jgi:hypothetical protein
MPRLAALTSTRVLETPSGLFVSRLMAQAACQPGLFQCFTVLLDPSPATPQLRTLPNAVVPPGATYGHARRGAVGIVCGFMRGSDGHVCLNPPDGEALQPGDRLVVLLRPEEAIAGASGSGDGSRTEGGESPGGSGSVVVYREAAAAAARVRMEAASQVAATGSRNSGGGSWPQRRCPRRILVVGWPSEELQTLLEGLATFSCGSGGAQITVVSAQAPPASQPALAAGAPAVLRPLEHHTHQPGLAAAQRTKSGRFGSRWGVGGSRGGGRGVAHSTVRYIQTREPLNDAALAAAGIADCDAVVVGTASSLSAAGSSAGALPAPGGGSDASSAMAAEASVLARDAPLLHALLSLQRALLASGRAVSGRRCTASLACSAWTFVAADSCVPISMPPYQQASCRLSHPAPNPVAFALAQL